MRLRVSRILLFVMALAALGVAAACGDDDGGGTPTASPPPTPEASRTPLPFDATPTPTPPPATTEAGMEVTEFVIKPNVTRARPGTVIFKVRNSGAVTHQFLVIRSDLPIAQLPRKTGDTGVDETQVDIAGRIDVETALAQMPTGYRAVLVLHDVMGFTHEEIAERLGIEVGTSKSQLSRARRAMRRALRIREPNDVTRP